MGSSVGHKGDHEVRPPKQNGLGLWIKISWFLDELLRWTAERSANISLRRCRDGHNQVSGRLVQLEAFRMNETSHSGPYSVAGSKTLTKLAIAPVWPRFCLPFTWSFLWSRLSHPIWWQVYVLVYYILLALVSVPHSTLCFLVHFLKSTRLGHYKPLHVGQPTNHLFLLKEKLVVKLSHCHLQFFLTCPAFSCYYCSSLWWVTFFKKKFCQSCVFWNFLLPLVASIAG